MFLWKKLFLSLTARLFIFALAITSGAAAAADPQRTLSIAGLKSLIVHSPGSATTSEPVSLPSHSLAVAIDDERSRIWVVTKARKVLVYDFSLEIQNSFTLPPDNEHTKRSRKDSADSNHENDDDNDESRSDEKPDNVKGDRRYHDEKHKSISHATISIDKHDGSIWITGDTSIFKFTSSGQRILSISHKRDITHSAVDVRSGVLWFTDGHSVISYTEGGLQQQTLTLPKSFSVRDMVFDLNLASLWVASEHEISRYSSAGQLQKRFRVEKIKQISPDGAGNIWVVSKKDVFRFSPEGDLQLKASLTRNHDRRDDVEIEAIASDVNDATLWILSEHALNHVISSGGSETVLTSVPRRGVLATSGDIHPPILSINDRKDGDLVKPQPELVFTYSDIGVGVDTATIRMFVNGEAAELSCTPDADNLNCTPKNAFSAETLKLRFDIQDRALNQSEAISVILKLDTDGDGVADERDTYPNDPSRWRLADVSGVTASLEQTSVSLQWNEHTDPEKTIGYNLYRKEAVQESEVKLNQELLTSTTYTDGNVVNGQGYRYRVVAVESRSFEGEPGDYQDIFIAYNLTPVSNFIAQREGGAVRCAWNAADGYRYQLYRSIGDVEPQPFSQIETTTYLDMAAHWASSYRYQIATIADFINVFTNEAVSVIGPRSSVVVVPPLPQLTLRLDNATADNSGLHHLTSTTSPVAVSGSYTAAVGPVTVTAVSGVESVTTESETGVFQLVLPVSGRNQWGITLTEKTLPDRWISASLALVLDSDADGIAEDIDQCPDTPANEQADGEGCSDSQKDADGDGITGASDLCPHTPPGEPVDAEGCAASERDSDKDGYIDSIDAFPSDPTEWLDTDLDGIGNNADSDIDGDGVANTDDAFPLDSTESRDTDQDGIGDNVDPDRDGDGVANEDDFFPDDPTAWSVPTVTITSPNSLTTFGASPILVSGTIDDPNVLLTINGIEVAHTGGNYQANVAIEEGHNSIVVRAVDAKGHEGTATIAVSLDKTPPYITVESPQNGEVVRNQSITVTGLVNDIVRGTVAEDQAVVTVNGVQAFVSNRSYMVENLSLTEGDNTITINASDAVGNIETKTITVRYEPVTGSKIEMVSGQGQGALIQSALSDPLAVKLLDGYGTPVVDKNVVFRVIQGDGVLAVGTADESQGVLVKTDSQGVASTTFRVGSRAGEGIHRVRAKAVGFDGEVVFHASADPNPGDKVSVIAGNNQRGIVRQPLPEPFVVAVTDNGANLILNAQVEFTVKKGGGKFLNNGEQIYRAMTDTDGRASVQYVLGPDEGLDVQYVEAKLIGTEAKAGFTVSGFMPGDPGKTSVSGVVLDNQDNPIPGVTVRVDGTTRQAAADENGQFIITEVPVGPLHLIADGGTAQVEGEWPTLSYNIVTVAGVENPLSAPIYMVKLDTKNGVMVGDEDVDYTLPEIPGFKLKVKSGSVTFPDGAKKGVLSVTAVNANKIPMPPPNGMQPQFIVTIQPTGAKFDPPAELSLPNVDGHKPGAQVEMYSYDHDLEEFVTIGVGTVSSDGSVIKSNPGVGVIKAGWHCGSQPGGSGCCEGGSGANCGYCENRVGECPNVSCEFVPDRPAQNQVPHNCQKELCGGSEPDPSDVPEDSPSDCQDPVCVGPPAPDDGETPQQDCMECQGGTAVPVEGHVMKREQKPDDCKVLYCDGNHEDAPNEPVPTESQTPNDCKELKCDGSEVAADDPNEDTDQEDCSRPICVGTNHDVELASNQNKPDEEVDACNKRTYSCVEINGTPSNQAKDEKYTGTPLIDTGDKCQECDDGTLINYDGWIISPSVTKQLSVPSAASGAAENLLKRFGVQVNSNWTGEASVKVEGCCDGATGQKGEKWTGSISAGASVALDLQVWPCPGCPPPNVDINVGGALAYIIVGVNVQGGVYAVGNVSVNGSVTRINNDCGENCTEVALNAAGSIGAEGRISGEVCYVQGGAILSDISACGAIGAAIGGNAKARGKIAGSTCSGLTSDVCFEGFSAYAKIFAEVTYQGVKYGDTLEITTPSVWGNCN